MKEMCVFFNPLYMESINIWIWNWIWNVCKVITGRDWYMHEKETILEKGWLLFAMCR